MSPIETRRKFLIVLASVLTIAGVLIVSPRDVRADVAGDLISSSLASESCPHELNVNSTRRQASFGAQDDYERHITIEAHGHKPSNWMFNYFEEQKPGFVVRIREKSIDERLANVVRTMRWVRAFDLTSFMFNVGDEQENLRLEQLAAGPKVDDAACRAHLQEMLEQIGDLSQIVEGRRTNQGTETEEHLDERHIRLAKVLDSFGRYESGSLLGRNLYLGSHGQCKGSQLLLGNQLIGSRFCMAHLDISKHLSRLARQENASIPGRDQLYSAICLPETCHSKSFAQNRALLQAIVDSQFELPRGLYQEQHPRLESVFCEIDEESPLIRIPLSGRILLALMAGWIVAMIYFTRINARARNRGGSDAKLAEFVQCMDLRKSWQDFTSETDRNFAGDEHRVSLDALNFIRVIGCLFVILGHSIVAQSMTSINPIKTVYDIGKDAPLFPLIAGSVIVDTFFVMTGAIMSFLTLKVVTKHQLKRASLAAKKDKPPSSTEGGFVDSCKQCLALIVIRFLRLVPMYYLVFWFKKSVLLNYSAEPFWDHGYNQDTMNGFCRTESWLTPVAFLAAYRPMKQCLPMTWSVAGDLFATLIVAPLIFLLAKRPKLATLVAIVLCLISNYSMFLRFEDQFDPALMADLGRFKMYAIGQFVRNNINYTAAHGRVFAYIIGAVTGYIGFKHIESDKPWPAYFRGFLTYLSVLVMIIILAAPSLNAMDDKHQPEFAFHDRLFIHSMTTAKLIWALANAVVGLRMATDWKDTFLCRIGNAKFMKSIVRLNYIILLIHMDVILYGVYKQTSREYFSKYYAIKTAAACYLLCQPIALFLYLFFEYPINKLTGTLMMSLTASMRE